MPAGPQSVTSRRPAASCASRRASSALRPTKREAGRLSSTVRSWGKAESMIGEIDRPDEDRIVWIDEVDMDAARLRIDRDRHDGGDLGPRRAGAVASSDLRAAVQHDDLRRAR